ncbi:MAG: ERCC4 domain-containing protein [Candidatus Pacearchaeota archaeon]
MKIIADIREKNSLVIAELKNLGVEVELKHLTLADYLISNEIAVERKTINDFISSMINKRLPKQLYDLKNNFKIPLLIIEKEDYHSLYKPSLHSRIHENAVRGMLLSIATEFQIPFIFTEGYEDTANYLMLLAKKQLKRRKDISLIVKRKVYSIKEQQQMIVESFPGIGPSLAKEMLRHFKSIKNISNASLEELEKVPKLGKKKALIIKKLLEINY